MNTLWRSILLLFALLPVCLSIKCYMCSTDIADGLSCFEPDGLGLPITCSSEEDSCLKVKLEERDGKVSYMRSCFNAEDALYENMCVHGDGLDGTKSTSCICSTDECNSSLMNYASLVNIVGAMVLKILM